MLLNELDQNSCIYTYPRHKDFVYVDCFHCVMMCILEEYLYVYVSFACYGDLDGFHKDVLGSHSLIFLFL